jgi:hypothetical protein
MSFIINDLRRILACRTDRIFCKHTKKYTMFHQAWLVGARIIGKGKIDGNSKLRKAIREYATADKRAVE